MIKNDVISTQRDNFTQMCIHTPDFGLGCFFMKIVIEYLLISSI